MDHDLSWVAQAFGAIAICCSLLIYSRNDRKKLLIFKCIQDLCWCTHYLLLGAFSAVATSGLCIGRSMAFYGNPKKQRKSKLLLVLFLVLYAISAALTWKNAFSILPALSSSISTFAFWMKEPRHTKMLAILASWITLSYNITVTHSPSVYVAVTFTTLTSVVSLIVQARKNNAEKRL